MTRMEILTWISYDIERFPFGRKPTVFITKALLVRLTDLPVLVTPGVRLTLFGCDVKLVSAGSAMWWVVGLPGEVEEVED